jgi:hypothetical protein
MVCAYAKSSMPCQSRHLCGGVEVGIRALLTTLDKTVPDETGVRITHHHLAQGFDAVI